MDEKTGRKQLLNKVQEVQAGWLKVNPFLNSLIGLYGNHAK